MSIYRTLYLIFRNLELLCLFNCKLREIPREILTLKNLKILYLEENKIEKVSAKLVTIPSLLELNFGRNPIVNIPAEIIEQGLPSIRNYSSLLGTTNETAYLYEAKLVFVGRGFAGKTSLIRKLTIPDYKLEKNIKSTEGIDIKYWDLKIQLEKSAVFRFNIWDFGGQEKYDVTHQFFRTGKDFNILSQKHDRKATS